MKTLFTVAAFAVLIAFGASIMAQQPAPLPTEGHNANAATQPTPPVPHSPYFREQQRQMSLAQAATQPAGSAIAAAAVQDTIAASGAMFSWQLDITKMLAVPSCAGISGCTIFTKICQANNGGNCIDLRDGANTYQIIADRTVNGVIVRTEIGNLGIGVQKMTLGPGQLTF